MKNKLRKIIFGILIIINCATIFYLSNQDADSSSAQSSTIVNIISNIVPNIKNMQEPDKTIFIEQTLTPIVRKTAHFSIYALLGMLTINFMLAYKGRSYYQKGLTSFVFCLIYAISDEIHQNFISGRSCEFRDVYIDTLGAVIGILIVILITRVYRKIRHKEEKYKINKNTKIMFISSTGGHFSELMQLKSIMNKCDYNIVTEKTKTNENLKNNYKNKIHFLIYGTKRDKTYPFVLLANCFISLFLYLKQRPQIVITTGTHTAGPMCCIARILGSKVIYIETFANRNSKTSAGKLLYYVANTFIVQWEDMLKLYPKAKYWGWIF